MFFASVVLFLVLLFYGLAHAQPSSFPSTPGSKTGILDANGVQVGNQNPLSSVGAPNTINLTWKTLNCGATSTPFGAVGLVYLTIQIPSGGQSVGFGWNAAAATMASPSQVFQAGTTIVWGGGTGSCIVASGTQPITIGYR
jgi:hypothetical protein